MSNIDWKKERSYFKACEDQVYFLSSALGPLSDPVYQSYIDYTNTLRTTGDARWMETLAKIEEGRALIARHIEANIEDIGFCPNTSFAMNILAMMLKSSAPEGEILSCEEEFPSSTLPWKHHGFKVKLVPAAELLDHVTDQTRAVVVSAVQFSTGYRQDLIHLGQVLAEKKIPYIANTTQAFGAYPISAREAQFTAMTASCHKWLCSGMGVSVLYLHPSFREKFEWPMAGWFSVEDIGAMNNKDYKLRSATSAVELGTMPFITLLGIKAGMEHVERIGVKNIAERIQDLSLKLEAKLKEISALEILSKRDQEADFSKSINSGILLLKISTDPEEVVEKLMAKNIYVSARRGFLRVAVHYFNNEKDIELFTQALKEVL